MKSKEQTYRKLSVTGITSNDKNGFWFLFLFGLVFFLIGAFAASKALPQAIEEGEYQAFLILMFAIVGAALMWFAWHRRQNYLLVGPTPLFLDPLPPVVGGEIGAYVDVKGLISDSDLKVTLTCIKRIKSGKNTRTRVLWQHDQVPYCKTTSNGSRVKFIFDCPDDVLPARGNVFWNIDLRGNINKGGEKKKIRRTWALPLEPAGEVVKSGIDIPEHFLKAQADEVTRIAQLSASEQIPVFEENGFLNIQSHYGRGIGGILGGVIFGVIFAGAGYFFRSEWWPAYIFIAIGVLVLFTSVFIWGRKIEVKIDMALRMLHMRRSWFNIKLYHREVALFNPEQFSLKKSSSQTSGQTLTEFFALSVESKGKQVKVAEGVKGRATAEALLEKITQSAFPNRTH